VAGGRPHASPTIPSWPNASRRRCHQQATTLPRARPPGLACTRVDPLGSKPAGRSSGAKFGIAGPGDRWRRSTAIARSSLPGPSARLARATPWPQAGAAGCPGPPAGDCPPQHQARWLARAGGTGWQREAIHHLKLPGAKARTPWPPKPRGHVSPSDSHNPAKRRWPSGPHSHWVLHSLPCSGDSGRQASCRPGPLRRCKSLFGCD